MNTPLYIQIRQFVFEDFFRHSDYSRPVMTERALAEKFGVSRTTVRRALDDLVEGKYLERRNRNGMYFSRNYMVPNSARYPKILIVFGDGKYSYLSYEFLWMLSRVSGYYSTRKIRISHVELNSSNPPEEELKFYFPDGILWVMPHREMSPVIAECRKSFPVQVLFGLDINCPDSICVDYRAGAENAARFFLEHGIADPWLLGITTGLKRSPFAEVWRKAFPKGTILSVPDCPENFLRERFRQTPPSGIFCFWSEYAELTPLLPELDPACLVLSDSIHAKNRLHLEPESEIDRACEILESMIYNLRPATSAECFTPIVR